MTSDHTDRSQLRYRNPVFPHSFPDPFVIKHNGEYFAYCTGIWHDGRVFGVLRSADLINWEPLGGAMERLDDPAPFYWAPELIYSDGVFYLYYSVGNETLMHIRVAASDRPDGGFRDTGHQLTFQDFAIDAHVFRDDDGTEYLFYATDFLGHTHIGTGIVVDRMLDRFTLAGEARPVVRAKYDWQVYDPARKEKGGVRWHTVEGPFVFKRKGTYFVMFSGGNWQNPTYGVSFATSASLERDGEWDQFCDGEKLLPILRTYPEKLIGPGHNSVVRGPNNREMYCVYHCWEHDERVVAVNRMDIIGERLVIEDEPFKEKLLPFLPDPQYSFQGGRWKPEHESAPDLGLLQSRTLNGLPASFLCEFDFKANAVSEGATFGFVLASGSETVARVVITASGEELSCEWQASAPVPPAIGIAAKETGALNHIRLEVDHSLVRLWLNAVNAPVNEWLAGSVDSLSLFSSGVDLQWSGFALTEGFEDRFEAYEGSSLEKFGWNVEGDPNSAILGEGELRLMASGSDLTLSKGRDHEAFEYTAVVRSVVAEERDSRFGFVVIGGGRRLYEFCVTVAGERFLLGDDSQSISFDLPLWYQSGNLHRFGFTRSEGQLLIDLDLVRIGSVPLSAEKARVGIRCINAEIAVESVRLTALPLRSAGG